MTAAGHSRRYFCRPAVAGRPAALRKVGTLRYPPAPTWGPSSCAGCSTAGRRAGSTAALRGDRSAGTRQPQARHPDASSAHTLSYQAHTSARQAVRRLRVHPVRLDELHLDAGGHAMAVDVRSGQAHQPRQRAVTRRAAASAHRVISVLLLLLLLLVLQQRGEPASRVAEQRLPGDHACVTVLLGACTALGLLHLGYLRGERASQGDRGHCRGPSWQQMVGSAMVRP